MNPTLAAPEDTAAPPPTPQASPQPSPGPVAFPPLEDGARVAGTVALSLATFMTVLDTSIANVSIPAISGDLGVSPGQGTWIITSFAVANANANTVAVVATAALAKAR